MIAVPHLPKDQWLRILSSVDGLASTLPKSGTYEPWRNATNWDLDEVYADLREEALRSRSEVSQIVAERKNQGAWPRGRYKAKFWLRARLEEAGAFVRRCVEEATDSAIEGDDHTMADQAAIKWLVWEAWDQHLVDLWLQGNLEFLAHYNHQEGIPENFVDYSNWLARVRTGHYVKK